jgi:hypothetical protein
MYLRKELNAMRDKLLQIRVDDDFISKVPEKYRNRVWEIANKIFKYNSTLKLIFDDYCKEVDKIDGDLKEKMIWITNHVSKEVQGQVREYVKSGKKHNNFVKKKHGNYIKLLEVENYLNI